MENDSPYYRHTKIIVTLGPATESDEQLARLIGAGVDVIRLNMAHATVQWVGEVVGRIRRISAEMERHVAVMMDVKGPEIRTGPVSTPLLLKVGSLLEFHTESSSAFGSDGQIKGNLASVSVNYPDFASDVEVGATVLVDSGLLRMRVVDKDPGCVRCEVLTQGNLGSRRHINLPGIEVNLPSLTEKDKLDLQAGVEAGMDFVALSFVRRAKDVDTLRDYLKSLRSNARIVAKIEEHSGVRNMEEIIHAADAVMVARGDLGIEIDYHKLPLVQTQLVKACQAEGKPVIIATHLLESMIHSPMPTRAEISDVSNAVRERADAVMLSGETTTGEYPLESVEVLKHIIESIEPTVDGSLNSIMKLCEPKAKMLRSAAVLAQELSDSGIIVFTRSGFLAYVLGALRAQGVPIYAFTDVESTFRQLLLPWGVEPFLMEFSDDPEQTIRQAMARLKEKGWCESSDWLIVITNVLAGQQIIDSMQLRQVD